MNRITKAMQHAVNQHEYDTSVLGGMLPEVTVVGKDPKISDELRQVKQEAAFKKANGNVTHLEFLMRPELREQKFNDLENYYKEKGWQYETNPISGKPELISPDTKWANGTISESNPAFSEKVWQAVAPDRTEGNFTTYLHTHPGVDNLLTAAGTAATGNALWKFGQSAIQGGRYLLPQIPKFMLVLKTNPAQAVGTGLGLVGAEILPRAGYGYAVNKASNALTGQSFGKNVATVLPGSDEGTVGELKEWVGDFANPGYSFRFGNTAMGKRAMESLMRTEGVNPIPDVVDSFVQDSKFPYRPGRFTYPLRYILTGESKLPTKVLTDIRTNEVIKNPKTAQLDKEHVKEVTIDPVRTYGDAAEEFLKYFPTWLDKLKLMFFPKRYALDYSPDDWKRWSPYGERTGIIDTNNRNWMKVNGDLVDAYVYDKLIDPKIATEMGKDWPHFSGNLDGKLPRVYQLNEWHDDPLNKEPALLKIDYSMVTKPQVPKPVIVPNSEAEKLMRNGSRTTAGSDNLLYLYDKSGHLQNPGFRFGKDKKGYEAGGYLVHKFLPKYPTEGNLTMASDNSPMLVAEDIWRYNPWRYGKRWIGKWYDDFNLGIGRLTSDFGQSAGYGAAIGWIDKYGHPFIMQSKPIYQNTLTPKEVAPTTPNLEELSLFPKGAFRSRK